MIGALERTIWQAWERFLDWVFVLLPNLLVMLVILTVGWMVARLAQWLLQRRSSRMESSLLQWGLAGSSGQTGAGYLLARGVCMFPRVFRDEFIDQ